MFKSMSMTGVHVHNWCPCPCLVSMSMPGVLIHAWCPCPCMVSISMSMPGVHVHVWCPCPCLLFCSIFCWNWYFFCRWVCYLLLIYQLTFWSPLTFSNLTLSNSYKVNVKAFQSYFLYIYRKLMLVEVKALGILKR